MPTSWRRGMFARIIIAILLAVALPLRAHDPGLSTLQIKLHRDRTEATLTLATRDAATLLDSFHGGNNTSSSAGRAAIESALMKLADTALQLSLDSRRADLGEPVVNVDDADNASIHFTLPQSSKQQLTVRSGWLSRLPGGHRQFLTIQSGDGAPLAERLLSARADSATVEVAPVAANSTASVSFLDFLALGMKHILIGYDHLLFLFSLLLVSRSYFATFKVITTFTVAHSITLVLATLDLISLPSAIVEPLIAASIVYVSVENFVRREMPASRLWLVFSFGLIHGLGFASVLRELGIATGANGVVVPLVSFNLGVELGQLLVALPLLPLLQRAGKTPAFDQRWIPACSAAAALAGGFWLVDRLLRLT